MTQGRVTIEALPDDVLLEIFESYISDSENPHKAWHPLVHTCRRWRYLVFASPRRLDLRLVCTNSTPVREKLDIWPPFLIEILSNFPNQDLGDNVIATLEHPDRIREIFLWSIRSPLDRLVLMMRKPFPELEHLSLGIDNVIVPTFPDTFLGGSAPRLRSLHLSRIPFPTLPRLLLSCNNLVTLVLSRIPNSGYISPEAMVTSLSVLTRLSFFSISFDSSGVWRTRHPPPTARAVLSSLTHLWFQSFSEYLEDLVARIDTPLLRGVDITLVDQPVFGIEQLTRFIGHPPTFMSYKQAQIDFTSRAISINCSSIEQHTSSEYLKLGISLTEGYLHVSSMAQLCNQFLFLMSRIERLYIQAPFQLFTAFRADMDNTHWLELFHPFTAVQALYLHHSFRSLTMSALQELSEESVTDILPALVDLYLEGYQGTALELQDVEPFIAARERSGRPVVVHCWDTTSSS